MRSSLYSFKDGAPKVSNGTNSLHFGAGNVKSNFMNYNPLLNAKSQDDHSKSV